MPDNNDRCSQLRKLHARILEELRILKESEREEEHDFENPIVTSEIIKSLQASLNTINLELQKCPPEE
jgi:hypothetical protein